MDENKINNCIKKLELLKHSRLDLVYMWVKQGHVNSEEFVYLIEFLCPG